MNGQFTDPVEVRNRLKQLYSDHEPLDVTIWSGSDHIRFHLETLTHRNPIRHGNRPFWTRVPVNLIVNGRPNAQATHVGLDPHLGTILLLGRGDERLSEPIPVHSMSVQVRSPQQPK